MKKQFSLLLLFVGISAPAQIQVGPADSSVNVLAETPYSVASRDGNQKIWSKITWESNSLTGELTAKTNSFIELTTGAAHLVNGAWIDSSDQIEITKTGAQATNSQHQVSFLGNINSSGAIDLTLPEGDKHLASSIIGLSYEDLATGKSVLIAEIKDSHGLLLQSGNQVLYPDAFTDLEADSVKADVLYQNKISGLEQLIVIRQQLPSPSEWGLSDDSSVLQVITAFENPPQPTITERKIGGMVDQHLDFGIVQMGQGVAFALGSETNTIPVTKQWVVLDGLQCLVEQTPFNQLAPLLKDLPGPSGHADLLNSPDGVLHRVASRHLLPERNLAQTSPAPAGIAVTKRFGETESDLSTPSPVGRERAGVRAALRAVPIKPFTIAANTKGVAIDWSAAVSQTNMTFQSDTTYYVSSNVTLSGTTTFEGGTIIKFTNSTSAKLSLNSFCVQNSAIQNGHSHLERR